jgi:uncharacterized protein YdhG (YjbR/CyaY superfamily)
MKNAKRTARGKVGTGRAVETVDSYLDSLPEPQRGTLNKVRATIRSMVPAETIETISYGIPTFKYKGSLLWYASFTKHCSLFPGSTVIEQLREELKNYTTSKGTIQFPVDKPIPAALLKKIIKACIAQKAEKKPR